MTLAPLIEEAKAYFEDGDEAGDEDEGEGDDEDGGRIGCRTNCYSRPATRMSLFELRRVPA